MFGSRRAEEEEVGLPRRAIPPIGPQPTWDPDIVAGLDEDFDYENNMLDDDFISRANCFDVNGDELHGEDGEFGSDFGSDDFSDEDNFSEEETKSRFTAYSMTSSVIRRNEQLSHLDDRFEKFYEGYDDDQIGDLSQVEIDGAHATHDVDGTKGMKMLLGIIDEEDEKKANEDCEELNEVESKKLKENLAYRYQHDDTENINNDLVEIVKEEPHVKWDCESIISTYSTLYNHPKVIQDVSSSKKKKEKRNQEVEDPPLVQETENIYTVDKKIFQRNKNETKEEKMLRKQMVKEAKKERRQEKKATKTAFKVEQTRQNKQLINLQQNLSGIRIS